MRELFKVLNMCTHARRVTVSLGHGQTIPQSKAEIAGDTPMTLFRGCATISSIERNVLQMCCVTSSDSDEMLASLMTMPRDV